MDAQISIGQLINILLVVAGGGVLIMIFKTLISINSIASNISRIMQDNEENINSILSSIPEILNNTEQITESVNEEMQHVSQAVKAIGETVEHTASAAQLVTEDIVLPIKEILAVLGIVKDIFIKDKNKDKKKGWFKN